ncbi:MAG: Mini-ribonuclease 3 [Lachnospiraceae bacterium]
MGTDLNKGMCSDIIETFHTDGIKDIRSLSPLTLAYMGDAVFEMVIRTILVTDEERTVQKYHKKCTSYVNAAAQRKLYTIIEPLLTEEEHTVFRRGRNAKSYTMPKNSVPADYRAATGFEALCGYLYLTDQMNRLLYLIAEGIHSVNMSNDDKKKTSESI